MIDIKRILSAVLMCTLCTALQSCGETIDPNESTADAATLSELEEWDRIKEAKKNGTTLASASDEETESKSDDTSSETVEVQELSADKGNIYDVNGTLLMQTSGSGENAYRSAPDTYRVPFANILNSRSNGLDAILDKTLRQKDTSVKLTYDADIQNSIYRYMESVNMVGSVIVMRTDGSLVAEASYPSYDPDTYGDADDSALTGYYGNRAEQPATPGSTFKIMSEVLAHKHGIDSLYDDGAWYADGGLITDWDYDTNPAYPIEERTRYSAFINSSNVFFAKCFDIIGTDAVIADLGDIFHYGSPINCDFGPVTSSLYIENADDLRRTAFGQANALVQPMYLAAVTREAVFGDMVTPFTLMSTVKGNDPSKVRDKGTQPEIVASIPSAYRQDLLDGMQGVGSDIGVYAPEGYTFYAKTGTAETGSGVNMYIAGCLRSASDDGGIRYQGYNGYAGSYVIVTQLQNGDEFGYRYASESAGMYQNIVNIVTSY